MKGISEQQSPSRMLILPLVILLVITLSSTFTIVIYSVIQVNKDTRLSSQEYVAAIIKDKLSQQATLAKDYAYWDETIENAYLQQNSKWINDNIGSYLTETFDVSDLFIINEDNKNIVSLKEGKEDSSNYTTIHKPALLSLIKQARLSTALPVPVSAIIMIDNTPAIVGASILTPEDKSAFPAPQPVLIIAKRLNKKELLVLSKKYRLSNLSFYKKAQTNPEQATFKLVNSENKDVGILSWQPDKPGSMMLTNIKYPLLILLFGLSLITYIIIRAALSTSQQLKDAYSYMEHLANHDVLTGLANRRLFDELLEQTIHAAKRDDIASAMLYLDLDGFKKVNDTYGHYEGDKLLKTVSERLKHSVREADTIARIGGDEFTILLRNTSSHDDIEKTVKKIQKYIEQPIHLSGNKASISVSVGITLIPQDGVEPNELMTKADKALYACKNQGKNIYKFYDPSMQ